MSNRHIKKAHIVAFDLGRPCEAAMLIRLAHISLTAIDVSPAHLNWRHEVIDASDLCGIPAFDEEKLKVVFHSAYTRVFHLLGGDGHVAACQIIDSITEEVHSRLHSMVIDAVEELDW